MMGYTHAIIGAGSSVALNVIAGDGTPEQLIVSAVTGALGGIVADVEVKDRHSNPSVTDAGMTRMAVCGLIGLFILLDFAFHMGFAEKVISGRYFALGGGIVFLLLLFVGSFTSHRTFTHSLLFILFTSFCLFCVCEDFAFYYIVGGLTHLFLDMLNFPVNDHGIWLFYPLRITKGIAFKMCKAAGTANKIFYFLGVALYSVMIGLYTFSIGTIKVAIAPILVLAYLLIALHFVRIKSEREQRHIMYMKRKPRTPHRSKEIVYEIRDGKVQKL